MRQPAGTPALAGVNFGPTTDCARRVSTLTKGTRDKKPTDIAFVPDVQWNQVPIYYLFAISTS